jgi:hypothetical protein
MNLSDTGLSISGDVIGTEIQYSPAYSLTSRTE